jgi:RNA polymerase sigma factor (sigma-70 family)
MTPTELLDLSTRIASGIAGRHQDIEDLAQEGVLAMLQSAPFDGRGSEEKYFGWRARNGIVDYIRVQPGTSRGQGVAPVFMGLDAIAELAEEPTHDDQMNAEQTRDRVRRAIAALPAREAAVVRGYYYHDQHQPEIARALAICPSRVSQLLAQARRRLREALREEDS